jgi:hypothetical protein
MKGANRRRASSDDDERLTPEEERSIGYGVAEAKAGLTYGPFGKGDISLGMFLKRQKATRRVSLPIPVILYNYLEKETKRFGMTATELMATIIETHRFKDQDRQLILMAMDQRTTTAGRKKRTTLQDAARPTQRTTPRKIGGRRTVSKA